MSRTNEHGQPIGDPVEWTPRPRPGRVRLAGHHVALEPVAGEHVSDLHAHLARPADDPLWTYRPDPRPADLAETARRVVAWAASEDTLTWAVVPAATGEASGVVSFHRIDPTMGSVEVAAVLFARSLQRTAAATEAIVLLAAHAFEALGYRRLEWKLDHHNAPSAAAARRLGFTYEGRFRNALVYKGRSRDTDWFAMTDDDWRALRPAYDTWLDPDNFDADGRQRSRLSDLTGAALPRP